MRDCNERETKGSAMLDQPILDDIIQRIVEVAQPEKIILFGSAARGDMNRHSDVDLLIIKEGADALELMGEIYMNLDGVGAAVDAVVVTPDDVERYKDSHAVIIKPILSVVLVLHCTVDIKYVQLQGRQYSDARVCNPSERVFN